MASYNWDVRNFENRGREGCGRHAACPAFCSSTLTAASVVLGSQAPHMPVLTLLLLYSLYLRKLQKHRDTQLSL